MATLERIFNGDQFLGLIIRKDYHESGIQFLTDDQSPQQLGYMNRAKDYIIAPHVHNVVTRTVELTQEVLIIQRGKVRVDYYDDNKDYLESRIAYEGDIVYLGYGGHGYPGRNQIAAERRERRLGKPAFCHTDPAGAEFCQAGDENGNPDASARTEDDC